MVRLFIRHDVADFDRWKVGYSDSTGDALRAEHGVRDPAVFRDADRPNDVTVCHDFDSVESARAFASDPRLSAAMADLGVAGEPQVWIATEA